MAEVPGLFPDTLMGFPIRKCEHMQGCKIAVQEGVTLFVSPAMYDLISHAESSEELERVLGAIRVLKIPDLASLDLSNCLTTRPDLG